MINAGLGLGAPVVDGVTTPDVLRMDDRGRVVESIIAHKAVATVVTARGLAEVPAESPDSPALAAHEILELAEIALRLERLDRAAWDVEFACDPAKTWWCRRVRSRDAASPRGATRTRSGARSTSARRSRASRPR